MGCLAVPFKSVRRCADTSQGDIYVESDPPDDQSSRQERRAAPRFSIKGPVNFEAGFTEGWGTLADISTKGARIDDADPRLKKGSRVGLMISLVEGALPIRVTAKVVRETERGFAVEFAELEPRLKQLIRLAVAQDDSSAR
jgi:hypothetical protein